MSSNLQTFCFINNDTNKCKDENYTIVYDNNGTDVYKVNYYSSPSSTNLYPGPNTSQEVTGLNTYMFNNNTQSFARAGHDEGNNTTFTNK